MCDSFCDGVYVMVVCDSLWCVIVSVMVCVCDSLWCVIVSVMVCVCDSLCDGCGDSLCDGVCV